MTLTEALAIRALAPVTTADHQRLRALSAGNIAAGLGVLGSAGALLDRLPLDANRFGDAAFLWASRLHARTQDDFHPFGRVHVGVVTLGATLALAARSKTRLLECLAGGYEVMCCVATAYSRTVQRRGYRPTGVFGPLGAAASAGIALGLDRAGIANAIGLAAARSGGTMQSWLTGTDEWILEVGAAARAGIEAALFSEAGVIAAPDALEGFAGWARAYFDDDGESLSRAVERNQSYISEVASKPYPVSGIAQVATHLASRAHESFAAAAIRSAIVRLATPEAEYPGSLNKGPFRSRSDALMSVAFCVACALMDGTVSITRLEQPNVGLTTLIEAVRVEADPALDEGQAVLTLSTSDGEFEYAGNGAAILEPDWVTLSADPEGLASRSEADLPLVRRLVELLNIEHPDSREIAELLKDVV